MNKDKRVIEEFGEEWSRYQYDSLDEKKIYENFKQYFSIFPWDKISSKSKGFDMGCGSGRWAKIVAPRVGFLNCIEPSAAIEVAKRNLKKSNNVKFFAETTDTCSIKPGSQDFGYCLGVLHHIPDTRAALMDCTRLLKPNAVFLLYLYYNFENKPLWFKVLWKASDYLRRFVSRLPRFSKKIVCELIALLVYLPLCRASKILELIGINVANIPLADYRKKPFYQMRNDALDRFGTRLEKRFSRKDIEDMLEESGMDRIIFSDSTPYWCCISYKR